ncbi:MAG: diadenylate cyclase CdaA [Bacteroidaceae bacterium]|nr:diadenylate cyclase CdaA [Bacteroidaceae bacterium]
MLIDFGIKDLLDILLVAYLLYQLYKLMKESGSLNIFAGVLIFLTIWVLVSQVLEMRLLGSIFDILQNVGVIALIVLFQDEIRRFLLSLGTRHRGRRWLKFFTSNKKEGREQTDTLPIAMACLSMSKQKVGALIVIEKQLPLNEIIRTGEPIDANINQRLIENIFFKNSPLHDGAMIISKNRIKAAGCILPVSHDLNIPKHLGLRHRAALGISQESDALVIVVSEETGAISMAQNGKIRLRLSAEELERTLTTEQSNP